MLRLGARLWMSHFRLCYQDGGWRKLDLTPGGDGLMAHGKRRLIRGEGFASRVSGYVRPQDPGRGAMPIVAPRRMMNNDVSNTPELSGGGGGGPQSVSSRISVVLVDAGGTTGRECPCDRV